MTSDDYTLSMSELSRTLVIGDGDLSTIIAAAAAADAALLAEPDPERRRALRPVMYVPPLFGVSAAARKWALRRQAELFEMELVEASADSREKPQGGTGQGEWPRDTLNLVQASVAAIERGCTQVVWPTHTVHAQSPDLDDVARAVDRALLVARLISLDGDHHGQPGFRIETPLVDLSDRQLADLVIDMDLPVRLCWWWHAEMSQGGAAEFRTHHDRWTAVLREVGWRESSEPRGHTVEKPAAGGV